VKATIRCGGCYGTWASESGRALKVFRSDHASDNLFDKESEISHGEQLVLKAA
jgi:hypothetical protein